MDNQGRTTEQSIKDLELRVVHEELLEGVTGSVPGNRSDIDRILLRKRKDNDFKVLLVQDTSRFTRAGQGHGQKLLYELRAAGILVYFVAEDLLVDDEMAEMYVSFLFAAARHAVKQLSYNATIGSTNSFLSGRSPYTRRPPFGLDRMYCDGGIDRHIIRNLSDGTQQQLTPAGEFVRSFGRNNKKGIPEHYIKQKSERIRLIPGDLKLMAVVHLMFHLHYVEGLSYRFVARRLNDAGTPSPMGREWHTGSVRQVLLNPVYIGRGIRCRTKNGIYYVSSEGRPQPSEVTLEELANNAHVRGRMRPREEWLERPQPHLADFLPEQLGKLATVGIERYLDSIAEAKPKEANRDRHRNSLYILKGSLRSRQGNHPMTGRLGGKEGNEIRYYAVSRGHTVPKSNNVLSGRIAAQPLESAIIGVLRQVLLNRPNMEETIKRLVAQQMLERREDEHSPERLEREIERKQKQLVLLSDDVTLEDDDPVARKATALKAEINSLKRRREAQPPQQRPATDVGTIAAELARELEEFGRQIDQQDVPHMQRLLELVVAKMEADLVTKEVDVELSLPSWLGEVLQRHGAVGLDELSAYRPFIEAHPENRLILDTFRCDRHGQPVCYTCRRRAA